METIGQPGVFSSVLWESCRIVDNDAPIPVERVIFLLNPMLEFYFYMNS